MAKLIPNEAPKLSKDLPALTPSSVAHPDTWNPVHQALLDSVSYLGLEAEQKDVLISSLGSRLDDVEASSSVAIERAVKADWALRDNRIHHELWAPSFTLIDADAVGITDAVAGDDSIDVTSTAQIKRGEYYVLSVEGESIAGDEEDGGIDTEGCARELVQCVAILSDSRIRISKNLTRNFKGGELSRCSLNIVGASYAEGVDGDIWLSKKINIGASASGGAVVIRRTLNSTDVTLYYQDAETSEWSERKWSHRRQGGDIPAGFADYEYSLPMRGDGNLRAEVSGGEVTIRHIVIVSAPTGLGGFVNPEMRPSAPQIATPAAGEIDVTETPTISIENYDSPGGTPQQSLRLQLSINENFSPVLYDTGNLPAGLSYSLGENIIPEGTEVWVRPKVGDAAGLESDWGAASSFTTMSTYSYVRAPVVVSPTNSAVDVLETPRIITDAFSIVGEDITPDQVAAQYQIRELTGSWDAPLWDSGRDEENLTYIDTPSGVIKAGRKRYAIRSRKEDAVLGWSEWGAEIRITSKDVFANIVGVALVEAGKNGGEFVHIDGEGTPIISTGSFFDNHPVWGGIVDVSIDGQSMVKVPKFYKKHGYVTLPDGEEPVPCWWISDQPADGFELYPAFFKNGQEIDQFYIGKYQASMDGAKLSSKPGVNPTVSRSITQFIADAKARNTGGVEGFMLWSLYQWSAIQWLYLVENKTMDSQAKTGQGRVNASSAANVDASDVAQATYRGIVGLWGNVRQYMDGLKTGGGSIHVWDRQGYQKWVNTGKKRTAAAGSIYPVTFMKSKGSIDGDDYDFTDHFIGDTGPTSNTNATAPDYQYFSEASEYFPHVGGDWNQAAVAGLWCVYVFNSASNSYSYRGARLAKS